MIKSDLHVHTYFCDGENSPEEMVIQAIESGLTRLGLVAHSYVPFDSVGTLLPSKKVEFQTEIARLKEKYAPQIEILCGIEQDMCSQVDTSGFDYIIGDIHYFAKDGVFIACDNGEELFNQAVKDMFDGDYLSAVENYYKSMSEVVEKTNADYIGHFDLIQKYNENDKYFDSTCARYENAYKKAVDKLVKHNRPFEINTGAMLFRGKREPYPSKAIIEYIKQKGGSFILSSDSHSTDNLSMSAKLRKSEIINAILD